MSRKNHHYSSELSQFSKIVPIKTAYLRYAVCGCCLCIKNANCYKISSSRRISKGAENTRCGLQKIWNFVRSAWIKMYNSHTELKSYTGGSRMTKGRSTTCEERIALVRECIQPFAKFTHFCIRTHSVEHCRSFRTFRTS